jgi:ATP-dependent RNA helicase DeaD
MLRKVAGHIEDEPMPSEAEINELVTLRLVDEIIENEPGEVAISTFDRAVESGLDAQDIALAALQMLVHKSQSANGNGSMNGTTALALGVGKVDRVRPKDLVAVVCNEGGLKGDKIGQIDLLDRISVVEVPTADIAMLLSALSGSRIRGRWLKPRHADDWDFAPRY